MARVVQRRTPPYLLIVFVLLFVIATAMAVLFFSKYDTTSDELARKSQLNTKLVNSEQLDRGDIKQMIKNYSDSVRAGGRAKTVIGQLTEDNLVLANAVTGMPSTTFLEASNEIEKVFKEIKVQTRSGLVQHMSDFYKKLGVKDAEIAKLRDDGAKLGEQLDKTKKELADAQTDFDAKLRQKDQQIAALDQKFQNFETDHNQKLGQAKQEYQDSVEKINKQLKAQVDEISVLTRDRDRWKKKYEIIVGQKQAPLDTGGIVRKPDGEVREVHAQDNLVYINIGSKDRVTEGLRFTVYPYTGIPDTGVGKAIVEVTNIGEDVSECRIIQQSKDDPIIVGDLVANVVYHVLRTYSFVVEGAFDLNSTGEPTMLGNKAIKDLVRRYGGKLMNDVDVDTDYVVLGDRPSQPRKPADTDTREIWELYERRLKDFKRYQEVEDSAKSHQIPRLGGKRFLDLVGYVPTKPASAE
jgi:Skp family chaperone for outer membrane proteins